LISFPRHRNTTPHRWKFNNKSLQKKTHTYRKIPLIRFPPSSLTTQVCSG